VPVHFTERWNPQTFYAVKTLAVHRAIKQYQPDLIHAFGIETGNTTVALRTGLPVSCFIQGIIEHLYPYIGFTGKWRPKFQRHIEKSAVSRVKYFVAESEFASRWAKSHSPGADVALIPHPLRRSFLEQGTSAGGKRVISVGGVDPRKGMDTIVRAMAEVEDDQATLRIIGSGPDMNSLVQLAKDLGISDRVKVLGSMSSEQVMSELKQAAVFAIASRMDTSPNVVSEAHAMGLPVVGTRVGGIPEMIDEGKDGYLVEMDDHKMMAKRISMLLADPDKALQMGLVGREKVTVLNDPDRVAKAHVEFFERIRRDLEK